jgi:hypothetical protein
VLTTDWLKNIGPMNFLSYRRRYFETLAEKTHETAKL